MKKLGVLVVIGLMSVTASAVDWVVVAEDEEADFLVARDSISHKGSYSTAYVNIYYKNYKYIYDTPYNQLESLTLFDCNTPVRSKDLSMIVRLNDSAIDTFKPNADWSYTHPGTINEAISDFVCAYQ